MSDSDEEAFESADEDSSKTSKPIKQDIADKSKAVEKPVSEPEKELPKEPNAEAKATAEDDFTPQPAIDRGKDIDNPESKENVKKLFDKINEQEKETGWLSWKSKLLTTASTTVNTFTGAVGDGFNTVMQTAETALGAEPAEELAQRLETGDKNEDKQEVANVDDKEADKKDNNAWGSWGSWGLSGITSAVGKATNVLENTSKTVVSGSLNVLETIGKKTYETIAEGEHGLKSTLQKNKISLSQVLREAKQTADDNISHEEKFREDQEMNYSFLFDEFNGLVNLEALEMLSHQSECQLEKLQVLSNSKFRDQFESITSKFELSGDEEENEEKADEEHDFVTLLRQNATLLQSLNLSVDEELSKLSDLQVSLRSRISQDEISLSKGESVDSKDMYKQALSNLAHLTARVIILYHRVAQKVLASNKVEEFSAYNDGAESVSLISKLMNTEFGILSNQYAKNLNSCKDENDSLNTFITSVYFEASNSGRYASDALKLLVPVFQLAIAKQTISDD
ncbi:DgyrCDS3789 [Dimorphilus gyrociliatus]|uniref:DgyrCDS3789 n=1 Tax=Dimorphilus gyrociliatus TaxID=2664684 RepID=A0A7I8VJK6_9ANNE|nr:DgyrCDS3789 [Dimorphilus gyrociliatus]